MAKKRILKPDKKPKNEKWHLARYDAMNSYLSKNNWLEFDKERDCFKICKHEDCFEKIDNLDFEEAINAVRVYEKKILKME
jgi:hypothetical protein